jgi:DNA-binding transcriptional regulator YhcF (GntR family)
MFDELVEQLATEREMLPGEFTARMLAEQAGININTAERKLNALLKDGKLVRRKGICNGRLSNIYRKVEG